jgi:multiple sugar transport system substrate-binding protein
MLMLSLLLAACTTNQAQGKPGAEVANSRLTLLISGDPTDDAAYQKLVTAFVAEQTDIQVDLINIPSAGDFRKRLTSDFAAGAPPDLFLINYRRFATYAAKGAIEPLTAYLAHSSVMKAADYYPQALAAFTWNGDLACFPQNISSPVVYYNKALFDAARVAYPRDHWTWDELVTTAQTLTQDSDEDGVADVYGFGTEASIVRAAPFIWMNGGDIVDNPTAPTRLTLDRAESKEALLWFLALQNSLKVVPDAVAEEAESSLSRFVNGRLAMLIDSRRAAPEFRLIKAFDWDVAALPLGKVHASLLHSDGYCMSAASQQKQAAWRFIEFANSAAGQTVLAESGRTIPSNKALAESSLFLEPQARPFNSRVFLEAIPVMRHLPIMTTWSDIEGILNNEIASAFYGNVTLDQAIQAANEQSAEFLRH